MQPNNGNSNASQPNLPAIESEPTTPPSLLRTPETSPLKQVGAQNPTTVVATEAENAP